MPELQNVEWKAPWKDEYLAWICGFTNAQGGTLYVGKRIDKCRHAALLGGSGGMTAWSLYKNRIF